VPPSPTGEGFFLADVSSDFIHSPPYPPYTAPEFVTLFLPIIGFFSFLLENG